MLLLTTGRKEKLSVSKGSEIEVCSNEHEYVWYRAILEENLAKSKRKKLSVRHLKPLLKEDHLPPLVTTTFHRLIRPLPPQDPFPYVDFEEGDVIDAAHQGAWCSGWVLQVLGNRRFLVFLRSLPDVLELHRNDLRPHFVWKDQEWFRCQKRELVESDFNAGKAVEVRTQVEPYGDIWAPAIAIKEDEEDETLLVKYKSSSGEEDECTTKISLPFSKIRPSPPPFGLRAFGLMENVDALLDSGWCPGVVSKLLSGKRYTVLLGPNKHSQDFDHLQLRPSMEWKEGAWQTEEKVSGPHAPEETTASTRIRVTVRAASGAGKNFRATRSSCGATQNPPPVSSNGGGDISEAGKASVIEGGDTSLSEAALQLSGDLLASKMANSVMNGNTPVASQPEIAAAKLHSSVVLGVAATRLTKPAVKTRGKTSPRKNLQAMKNQKGSTNDSVGGKAPEESKDRECINKRKRGQPRKFVSTEPKQKSGVAANGSEAASVADTTDDDQPLASWIQGGNSSAGSGQPASRAPDPMLNSVVEKHVDVVETPAAKETTMVLPFAKKSPCWKVLESMEILQAVPQRPHFSPLLECEEESREGDAIGAMVKFTSLLEKVNNVQVDDPISVINRMDEGFLKLEKYGFDVSAPRSRIGKMLSIKESQTWALEEMQVVEREMTEKDKKRRKCEEDMEELARKIAELQEQGALLKEEKVKMDKGIARMQSHAAVLDQKVQKVEQEFRAAVSAPWNLLTFR